MPELKTVITIIEIVVGVAFAMALGDYLGYKIGRWNLLRGIIIAVLVCIVGFAIYAAIMLR